LPLGAVAAPLSSASASTPHDRGLLKLYQGKVVDANTNASNGDTNPYGVAVVPQTIGSLVAGNLLIADFNNAGGTSGAGTSIVQVNPQTGMTTDFATAQTLGNAALTGPVEIAINPANDYVWVGDFGTAADGSASNYLVISPTGALVSVESNATVAGNPSLGSWTNPFAGVWGAAVGVNASTMATSFYWTNIAGTASAAGSGEVWRTNPQGPSLPANSTFTPLAVGLPANPSMLLGPKGLAYDPQNDTLYVTDSANNAVYAIPHASTATGPVTPKLLYQNGPLSQPQDLALYPHSGLLVTVNGSAGPRGNNDMVGISTTGMLRGVVDLASRQPAGGLFGVAPGPLASHRFPTLYYDNANTSSLHLIAPNW
jgi:sugar lactone lactonase YvrE